MGFSGFCPPTGGHLFCGEGQQHSERPDTTQKSIISCQTTVPAKPSQDPSLCAHNQPRHADGSSHCAAVPQVAHGARGGRQLFGKPRLEARAAKELSARSGAPRCLPAPALLPRSRGVGGLGKAPQSPSSEQRRRQSRKGISQSAPPLGENIWVKKK